MECLSDKLRHDRRMALSYMQEAQITAGLLASHGLGIKQESVEKQSSSPPLNNNSSVSAAPMLEKSWAAAAASLSMLTPQQIVAASHMSHALMAAGIPVSLNTLNPISQAGASLYRHHQNLFGGWMPSASPPLHSPGPVSPALSSKSSQASRRTPNHISAAAAAAAANNNNNNNNNNNVVSSSVDRMSKKNGQSVAKKQRSSINVKIEKQENASASPPSSLSPDAPSVAGKDGRDKVFTCGVCSRSFGYKHVLQNHERTHTGEKPFKCPECNKRFTRDHHLKTHMRLHTGEKPYHCSHCDRQFVQVANLRRHLRVHTGERPYACELCSAKFSDSNQLKAHLLIHKNEKPFKCEHCHMRFRRRHHLVHHKCAVNPASHVTASAGATTVLPSSLVTAHLGSSSRSSHACSDDLEDEIDIDVDVEMDEDSLVLARHKQPARRNIPAIVQRSSPAATLPLNLSGIPADLPEQTEPEDLSMPASRSRNYRPQSHTHSHSSGGGSPMSHSPSSDIAHEDEEDEDDVENLDVARASPSSLFAPDARRVR